MYLTAETLDDMLRKVFQRLLKSGTHINPSRGPATEITGVFLKIMNPRARLSRSETRGKLFSCLGELLWYLAGTDNLKFVTYYVPAYKEESKDGKRVYGAYGPRLFSMRGNDQVANVTKVLRASNDSRRAVIQLFDAKDVKERRVEVPCTCTLQFMIRHNRLVMLTNMRSNDAFLGLSHDVFAFTMLQEILARSLGVEIGPYMHAVGSLHLYDPDIPKARQYLDEGWQSTVVMPAMPLGDPWQALKSVLAAEVAVRRGRSLPVLNSGLDPYWADLIRLLRVFKCFKTKKLEDVEALKKEMHSDVYRSYIETRQAQ